MKQTILALLCVFAIDAHASVAKYCGIIKDDGAQAIVNDGTYNVMIEWMSMTPAQDPKQIIDYVAQRLNKCLCVEGSVYRTNGFLAFQTLTGLFECNTLRRIK